MLIANASLTFLSGAAICLLALVQLTMPASRELGAWNLLMTAAYAWIGLGTLRR
jgi:hypothetical protein